jgi:hypothetical protein
MRIEDVTDADVVEVTMHGALFPAFRQWIEERGLFLAPLNFTKSEADVREDLAPILALDPGRRLDALTEYVQHETETLPTFGIGVGEALMHASFHRAKTVTMGDGDPVVTETPWARVEPGAD